MDSDTHVIGRIERLEQADRDLAEHMQKLAIQTERVAVSTEVLSEAMARQYEQNIKIAKMGERIGNLENSMTRQYDHNTNMNVADNRIAGLENSMDFLKKVGGTVLTVGVGLIMYFLFGGQV